MVRQQWQVDAEDDLGIVHVFSPCFVVETGVPGGSNKSETGGPRTFHWTPTRLNASMTTVQSLRLQLSSLQAETRSKDVSIGTRLNTTDLTT